MIDVLSLAGPERFAAGRTMDGYNRPVAEGTSRLGVEQGRHAQFPTISIRKKQRAKVGRDAQEIRGKALNQTAKIQLRGHAVRNVQQQVQSVAFMSQFVFKTLPF